MPLSECACEWDGTPPAPIMRKACAAHLEWRNKWATERIVAWMLENSFATGDAGSTGEALAQLKRQIEELRVRVSSEKTDAQAKAE